MSVFVIEDEIHADQVGEFVSRDLAEAELQRIALIPYGEVPNVAPCTSFATCARNYYLIEFETAAPEWKEVRRDNVLKVSGTGVVWVQNA